MSRLLPLVALLALSACGGGPTSPDGGTAQGIANSATPTITVNGVAAQPGTTINVAAGSRIEYRVDFKNNSGQTLHIAIAFVRDDGVERLALCGASGSGGDGGAVGSSINIFTNDPFFSPGRTVRVMLFTALGSGSTDCLFGSVTTGQVNHGAVQAERVLATFAVQ